LITSEHANICIKRRSGGLTDRCSGHRNWWRIGLVGNVVVGRINEVNQRRARLVLGWVTVFKTGKPSLYVTSHPGQLSLAIPPRVGIMSTGDDYGRRQGRNGEFCVTVGPVPGLLTYWPSPLSGGLGLYASLIGFNPRRLKVVKRGELPRDGPIAVYAKSSSSS